jgi:cation:H+ antiporter
MVLGGVLPETTPAAVAVVVAATGLIWVGSGWLEGAAERLSAHYGLPAVVQGSIVVAVGSSVPELASVVLTALAGAFEMGVGAIVGSAIFNVLVIPAVAGILTEDPLDVNRTVVYKEAQFYMLAVSVLLITFALGVIYYPVDDGDLVGTVTRPLALIPVALYGLYVFIQWQDVDDHEADDAGDGVAVGREWAKLAAGLLVILLAVESLVGAIEWLGATFDIPEFLAGVTILAAATSLPDALISVRAARGGRSVTSLGNVLGSNTFDLLIAIPIGVLIVGSATVSFAVAAPMMGVLTVATVLLFTLLRTDLRLTDVESSVLFVVYLLFLAWIVGETVGAIDLVVGA